MIKFVRSGMVGSAKICDQYDSKDNRIYVNYNNGKIRAIDIQTKTYLYPEISVDISKKDHLNFTLSYDGVKISYDDQAIFSINYNEACRFVNSELFEFVFTLLKEKGIDTEKETSYDLCQ